MLTVPISAFATWEAQKNSVSKWHNIYVNVLFLFFTHERQKDDDRTKTVALFLISFFQFSVLWSKGPQILKSPY